MKLVTPPGGTCLDPFAGSGATVEACMLEGFTVIGVEREAEYLPLIMQRVNRQYEARAAEVVSVVPSLFDDDPPTPQPSGRWPANVILDRNQAEALDQQSGIQKDGTAVRRNLSGRTRGTNTGFADQLTPEHGDLGYGGQGGASRFFLTVDPDDDEPAA